MKKLTAIALLIAAASFCFANGTQSGTAAGGANRPAGMTESGYPIVTDGSVTLRYWYTIEPGASKFIKSYAENIAFQEYAKRTGINIEWIHPAVGMEAEQYALMLTSGDLPDMISGSNHYRGGPFQGLYDGIFADLTEPIAKWAPDFYNILRNDAEFFREMSDENGRLCFFGAYKFGGDIPFNRPAIRVDVLEQLGLKEPRTIAEWDAMFAGMLSIGITPYMLARNGYERQFIAPYGILAGTGNEPFFKDANGKLYYGQVKPEFRQYLELMRDWYAKGYISKDFTSTNVNQVNTLFDTKKIGIVFGGIANTFNRGKTLGFAVTSAPYPRLTLGQQLHHENTDIWPFKNNDNTGTTISAKSKNIEAAVRWLNYGFSDAGALLLNWGVEGVNYNVIDGKKVYNDLMFKHPQLGTHEASYVYKMHAGPKRWEKDVECHASLLIAPDSLASRMLWGDDPNVDSLFMLPPYQLTEAEQNTRTRIMNQISTYADEMALKFITGAEPLSNFDAFVATINSMGLAEVLQSEQAAYDRYLQKTMK